MADDPHSTTGVLKKASPFWWWVRGNPSLVITLLAMAGGGIYGWHDIKSRLTAVESKVDELAKRPAEVSKKEFSDLHDMVAKMQGRWEQVDSVPDLRRRRH